MSYIILGIHGLANKPPHADLERGCQSAILEGLRLTCGNTEQRIEFKNIYWADVCYDQPLNPDSEPYCQAEPPLKSYKKGWWSDVVVGVLGVSGTPLDATHRYLGTDKFGEVVLAAKLQDLHKYYTEENIRKELRTRLRNALLAIPNDKRIMLVAHSMGSIIAYDVLRILGQDNPNFKLDHFVTLGSPLGLPHVKNKIYQENHMVRTPTVVQRWTNFSDRRDPVAIDVHLADDYEENNRGVKVEDQLVINSYISPKGKPNPHKLYGYLRTPEFSEVLRGFI